MSQPAIVDQYGKPMPDVTKVGQMPGYAQKKFHMAGNPKQLEFMTPPNRHPDLDWDDMTRDQMQAQIKHLIRNDEMAFGSIEQHVDAVVGKRFRLKPKPPQKLLGWDRPDTREFVACVRALWELDSESDSRWMDIGGKKTFSQLVAQYVRVFRIFGESFGVIYNVLRPAVRPFGMAAGLIDPARIRTPEQLENRGDIVGGVRVSQHNYPIEYFVAEKHPGGSPRDKYGFLPGGKEKFQRLKRNGKFGRVQMLHSYIEDLPGLTRGVPVFASALTRLNCLRGFQAHTLQAASWQASVLGTLESNYQDTGDVYVFDEDSNRSTSMNSVSYHMDERNTWNKLNNFHVGDQKLAQLWNGDQLKMNNPGQPISGYKEFERSMLKHFARALGTSYEWMAQDWSDTNYSGARAGLITTWRRIDVERANVAEEIANAMYSAWMEDNIANGRIKVPGFTDPSEAWLYFVANRDALTAADWYGPVKEEIDRAKTIAFYRELDEMNVSTDDMLANELLDTTFEDIKHQQTEEKIYAYEQAVQVQKSIDEMDDKLRPENMHLWCPKNEASPPKGRDAFDQRQAQAAQADMAEQVEANSNAQGAPA